MIVPSGPAGDFFVFFCRKKEQHCRLFCNFACRTLTNEPNMRQLLTIGTVLSVLLIFLTGCTRERPRYVIGVSQCSDDIWREKQNAELRMGAYLQGDVELRFAAAFDSDERQVQQIDSLVATGIDLLIVAPNQVQTISPAIDRAYDKGIPVIVFERKTNSQKHTAFISADNYEMGRVMGEYIASQLQGKGRVMEIMGLKGSSPAIERHNGFADALKNYPGIDIVATLQGDWTEESGHEAMKQWLSKEPIANSEKPIDFVFGQNDRMAIGARRAVTNSSLYTLHFSLTKYCGIDGLPGEDGGIRLVRDSILDASYIYPTHGDKILQLAIDILDGKPYPKETMLTSAIVTRENAKVLLLESDEVMRQTQNLEKLQEKASGYLQQLAAQRTITFLALILIALLTLSLVLFTLYHRSKISAQRERVVNNLWNLEVPAETTQPEVPQVQETKEEATIEASTPMEAENEPLFIVRFKDVVEAHLSDSDISVDDLAAEMNLSRVQLYRKVKAITGASPIELLRTARLNRAYQLLLTTDKNISEVAYGVGFTAPSYFTKCFKEEFGVGPSDLQTQ